jgi:hypothetical protein
MITRIVAKGLCALVAGLVAFGAAAQQWSAEQKEVWDLEQQQWKMAAAKDLSWIETMVHPGLSYWETGQPMPQDLSSLKRWNRYAAANGATLEQELMPISIVITGNVAVVNYYYQVAREDKDKKRETVTGRYMDVLMKDNGRWKFIAWAGGDDPKK